MQRKSTAKFRGHRNSGDTVPNLQDPRRSPFSVPACRHIFAFAIIMSCSSIGLSKPSILLGADYPYAYLSGIREAFEQFHERYHHYPKTWDDVWANCSDNPKLDGCDAILREPESRRRVLAPLTPDGKPSRYVYVIVSSGRTTYRIDVRDRNGTARFYSDDKHVAVPLK